MVLLRLFKRNNENFNYDEVLLADKTLLKPNSEISKNPRYDSTQTIWDILRESADKYPLNKFLGRRLLDKDGNPTIFVWRSYKKTFERINHLACGINQLIIESNDEETNQKQETQSKTSENGENPKINEIDQNNTKNDSTKQPKTCDDSDNQCIGIFAVNRPEWLETSLAIQSANHKVVPLYDSFNVDALKHIISQSSLKIIVCEQNKVEKLLEVVKNGGCCLRIIIQMDFDSLYQNISENVTTELTKMASDSGLKLLPFSTVLQNGKESINDFKPSRPKFNNLAYVMYTSGTSGLPKGVMLTHSNAISSINSVFERYDMSKRGSYLSFLPLAHIFETLMQLLMMASGHCIGYYSGHIKHLAEDLKHLRPHYFATVPRVIDKLHMKIMQSVQKSLMKRLLVQTALSKGKPLTRDAQLQMKTKPFDSLVWSKIRKKIGLDNVSLFVTGGAPMPPRLMEFLRVLLPAQVLQGYGLTETFALVSLSQANDVHLNHVGLPIGCEVKLSAVADMNYSPLNDPPSGEILVRGPSLFCGYLNDEKRTDDVMEDGWFQTGDIGRLNPNGTLTIVDRKKALFKLSQGEYVSPEEVEGVYQQLEAIQQIFVYGKSTQNRTVAIIVPCVHWCWKQTQKIEPDQKLHKKVGELIKNINFGDLRIEFQKLCGRNRDSLTEKCLKEMKKVDQNLRQFERIRMFHLEFDIDEMFNGFNVNNGLLTPSFKLRRTILAKRYSGIIAELYSAGPLLQ